MANGSSSSGATKGGASQGLGNSGGGGGGNEKVGIIPAKKNPFKPFKEYQHEFAKAKDAQSLGKVLEDNGVAISDKFLRYIESGKYPIENAKDFIKGTLLTISHYGDGERFVGFGAYKRSDSPIVAYYQHPTVVGSQGNGYIAVNIGHPSSRSKSIYGTGAHEGYHHVEGVIGDVKKIDMYTYSKDVVVRSYSSWGKKTGLSTGDIKKDFTTHVSSYGATKDSEALSEAMKNVIMHKGKASALSKTIFNEVRRDAKTYKTGKHNK